MFIRVVKLDADTATPPSRPRFTLKTEAGSPTQIPYKDEGLTAEIWATMNTSDPPAAYAFAVAESTTLPLYRVEVINNSPVPSGNWEITITNADSVDSHRFTWVVADNDADASQPWIHVDPALNFDDLGKHLTGQGVVVRTVLVSNWGTSTLTMTDPAGPVAGPVFNLGTLPGPINPGYSSTREVEFVPPGVSGSFTLLWDVGCDDPGPVTGSAGHNDRVEIRATSGQVEVMLLLDASGSMARKPDGTGAAAPGESRWDQLTLAAEQFLDLLDFFAGGLGRFGVAMFPDISSDAVIAPSPSSSTFPHVIGDGDTSDVPIATAAISAAKSAIGGQTPQFGATPIGDGIGLAMGLNAGSFGLFQGPGPAVDHNRRWLVLMSDGAHNSSPPEPQDFYRTDEDGAGAGAAGADESFQDKKIKVFTIGYGTPGPSAWEVDHELLKRLTRKSGVLEADGYRSADASTVGDLMKAFRSALIEGLYLDPTVDPPGVVTSATPEVRRTVTVSPYDSHVAFVVDWETFDSTRVDVQLVTPLCEVITPVAANADPEFGFHSGEQYAIFTFTDVYLHPAVGDDRAGPWTLIVTGQGLAAGATEHFTYEVLTRSRLRLRAKFGSARYFAGDPIDVAVSLTLDGRAISGAAVSLRITQPLGVRDNWIADASVSEQEFKAAQATLDPEDTTPIGIKAHAAVLKGSSFSGGTSEQKLDMAYDADAGIYRAEFTDTSRPGAYQVLITAIGALDDGTPIHRQQQLTVHLGVRVQPEFTLIDTAYHADAGAFRADVAARPMDRFGNVLLVDSTRITTVALSVDGDPLALESGLDGWYRTSIPLPPRAAPTIDLQLDGVPLGKIFPLAPLDRLRYVDRLVDFTPGLQPDPNADLTAILGDVTAPGGSDAVFLGGVGAITVRLARHLIRASGDRDITVFVGQHQSRRPYSVQARTGWLRRKWVELGRSPGVTQSFSLGDAGVRIARAIRITDQSGPVSKPDEPAGVSVAGVGLDVVETESWWVRLLTWIFGLFGGYSRE
ncbi:MAG: VWA domain-containing protein [Dehalococcoidia bacterium]|nr:VWA domain-containing protein [Dehalococcoidia bacterium]